MNIRAKIFGDSSPVDPSSILQTKNPKGVRGDDLHSIPVERQEKRRANTRDQDRHRFVDEHARVTHNRSAHDVQLVNVSCGGAMVSADFEVMPWDRLDLHLGDHGTIECSVLWVKDGRIGLEFAHETRLDCSADEQAELLREVISRNFPEAQFEAGEEPETEVAETPVEHENRSERRHPLIWSGMLHYDYESSPVRLRNISSMGATIETSVNIEEGAEPLLDLGDAGSVFGTVAWTFGDQVGLRFKEPFDVTRLAKSKPEVASPKWEMPSHLKQHITAESAGERWKRMSLSELSEELDGFLKR